MKKCDEIVDDLSHIENYVEMHIEICIIIQSKEKLVHKLGYPEAVLDFEYDHEVRDRGEKSRQKAFKCLFFCLLLQDNVIFSSLFSS